MVVVKYIRRYWLFFFLAFLLVVGYFILRLPNLTLQPIFADEAIYVRWAQVMKAEPTLRFLPVSDGKTPLWMWILMPVFKFISDPLLAGRLLSVFAGVGMLAGVLFLGWKYFTKQTALWAGLLIVITPYIVFFDRMALVDSLLAVFSIWSLIFTLLLVEYKRLDLAMILGGILGAGWLTKTPGLFAVLSLPLGLVSFTGWKKERINVYKILGLMLVSIIIAVGFYNILRLGPGFDALSSRNGDYIHPPTHVFTSPLDPFIPHVRDLADWLPKFLTWPILLLVVGGIILTLYRRNRFALVILGWSVFPLLVEMALLRTFTTRYILFTIAPLLFLAGWFIAESIGYLKELKRFKFFKFGVLETITLLLLLGFTLPFHYLLWTDPEKAPLPRESRRGYFEDWTAGYGLKEIAGYLKEQSVGGRTVVVGTEGAFGTLPDGLFIYLDKEPLIKVVPGKATISAELRQAALEHPTYYVSNKSRFNSRDGVRLIKEYPKAVGPDLPQDSMLLFEVLPE